MPSTIHSEYVPAPEAFRKLNYAWETKSAVYIYGVTGYGKTRLVQEFTADKDAFLVSAYNADAERMLEERLQSDPLPACVIIDDLHYSSDNLRRLISSLVKREDIRPMLIGRMPPPQWIYSLMEEGRMLIITEQDLMLSGKEILRMAEADQIPLTAEDAQTMSEHMLGNAYGISAALRLIKSGYTFDAGFLQKTDEMYEQHLEQNIISHWSTELQEFLMQISVVNSFTLQQAVMITGDDQAAAMIQTAAEMGNFLLSDNGTYRLRPQLISALRNRALKIYGLKRYRQFQNNAALFYETRGDILPALEIYEQCENRDGIRSVLIRNARRHPGTERYYELKKYYLGLTEEEIQTSIVLMSALSMLYSVLIDREKSEYWYKKLQEYAVRTSGREKDEANIQLVWLAIALPHRKSADIIDIFTKLPSVFRYRKNKFPEFSLTNNQPSLMNGGKDFCVWSRNDELLAKTLGSTVEKLLGEQGKGLVHTALAESFYEKGRPSGDILDHLTSARMEIEAGGRDALLFVVIGIRARMNIVMGNNRHASELLNGFENRIIGNTKNKRESEKLILRNLDAMRCRIMLLRPETEAVTAWMETAPDETREFLTLDRFLYLVKARVYLSLGKNEEALFLLKLLRNYAEWSNREYIYMETGLLLSVVLYRMKQEWKSLFQDSLNRAFGYNFTRIISEEGAAVLPLLKKVQTDYTGSGKSKVRQWFENVLAQTEQMASYYPGYLGMAPQKNEFSENGLKILRMQAEGKNIREIAQLLGVSERTVKYHAAENYRKLGARGKTDAVQLARNLNLL